MSLHMSKKVAVAARFVRGAARHALQCCRRLSWALSRLALPDLPLMASTTAAELPALACCSAMAAVGLAFASFAASSWR